MNTFFKLDASGKKLGRLATHAATLLIGKNEPNYSRNVLPKNKVNIINASKLDLTERKISGINHNRYSGYPGGFKSVSGAKTISKKGHGELIVQAVSRMLPKNKLRAIMLKNLTVQD